MRTHTHLLTLLGVLAALSQAAGAMSLEQTDAIQAAALRTVRAQAGAAAASLTLEAGALDPRLHVYECDRALTGFITNSGQIRSETTVGVRCEGSVRWTVYISVGVASQTTVLVARRSLMRNTEVSAADFSLETRRVPGLASAYVSDPGALVGQSLSRPINSGEPLTLETLAPANLIHRGQQVVLLAHAGGLEVRMVGVALADGHADERIKVQNQSSQRVIEGIVRSANEIEIPL
jgi:flagella basal body P-ring formation protein FlgA